MRPYTLLIIEDDADCASFMQGVFERCPLSSRLSISAAAPQGANVDDALSADQAPDILITDIDLGKGVPTGIDLVCARIPEGSHTQVIYVTGHIEYCTSVYETEHIYFLPKPIDEQLLERAVEKALEKLDELATQKPSDTDAPAPVSLTLKAGGRTIIVDCRQLEYIESKGRKACFHLDGGDCVEVYLTLENARKMLPSSFLQCHKSFLVNLDKIAELGPDGFTMDSKAWVPVSQKRRREAKKALLEHLKKRS